MQNNFLKENPPDLCGEEENCPPDKDAETNLQAMYSNNNSAASIDDKKSLFKHRILNVSVLLFTLALTAISVATFFIALIAGFAPPVCINGECVYPTLDAAYAIASTYILCMLLAAPTLKVFLDKCTSSALKKFNIITLVAIFVSILVLAAAISIAFVV